MCFADACVCAWADALCLRWYLVLVRMPVPVLSLVLMPVLVLVLSLMHLCACVDALCLCFLLPVVVDDEVTSTFWSHMPCDVLISVLVPLWMHSVYDADALCLFFTPLHCCRWWGNKYPPITACADAFSLCSYLLCFYCCPLILLVVGLLVAVQPIMKITSGKWWLMSMIYDWRLLGHWIFVSSEVVGFLPLFSESCLNHSYDSKNKC